jgi:hypothetical protein
MRKLILFTFAVCAMFLAAGPAAAGDTWTGTLIDADCRAADAVAKCAVTDATKSFGLLSSDGKFVGLDQAGNEKVMAALKSAPGPDADKKASITGQLKDGKLAVETVRIL